MFRVHFLAFLILMLTTTASFCTVTIGNGYWRVTLTAEDDSVHAAGSLTELTDINYGNHNWSNGRYFLTPRLFNCTLLNTQASSTNNSISFSSQSMLTNDNRVIPLRTEVEYKLEGPVLHVLYRFTAQGNIDEARPLDAYSEFSYTGIDGYTNGIHDFSFNTDSAQVNIGYDTYLNQFYVVHSNLSDLVLISPNPYFSQAVAVRLNGNTNRLHLEILNSYGPIAGMPGDPYHSVLTPGTVVTREFFLLAAPPQSAPSDIQHPLVYWSPHSSKADRSAIFMWDELPVPHPNDSGWLYSYDENGANVYLNGLINLMNNHPKSRMVLLTVPDGIWAGMGMENVGDYFGWAGWHGTNRMKNYAPSDYVTFLHDLANHNPAYPWMTRIDLASHGYHHTESPQDLEDHEFEIAGYDRAEALFHAAFDDLNSIGLPGSHILAGIRFPGFEYLQDTLRAGIKWGIHFYDNYKEFEHFRLTHEVFPEGEMWGVNTCWWADYSTEQPDWGRPFSYFTQLLDGGKIALLGGHPELSFNPTQPMSYQRMDTALSIIDQYDNLQWVWPSELIDRINRITALDGFSFVHTNENYQFLYSGGLAASDTLVIDNIPEGIAPYISIDGITISDYEYRSGRLYIEHCPVSSGQHTIIIPYYKIPEYLGNVTVKAYPNPSSGRVTFSISGSRVENPKVKVYALDGLLIDDGSNWNWIYPVVNTWTALRDYNRLASGVYLYIAEYTTVLGTSKTTGKFAIIK